MTQKLRLAEKQLVSGTKFGYFDFIPCVWRIFKADYVIRLNTYIFGAKSDIINLEKVNEDEGGKARQPQNG